MHRGRARRDGSHSRSCESHVLYSSFVQLDDQSSNWLSRKLYHSALVPEFDCGVRPLGFIMLPPLVEASFPKTMTLNFAVSWLPPIFNPIRLALDRGCRVSTDA